MVINGTSYRGSYKETKIFWQKKTSESFIKSVIDWGICTSLITVLDIDAFPDNTPSLRVILRFLYFLNK